MFASARRSSRLLPNSERSPPMAKLQHQALDEAFSLSRRGFLISMAGAGAAFGFAGTEGMAAAPPAHAQGAFEPTIWYSIDRDGIVTVKIIRAELGQQGGTRLAL